jgi:predicted metal-dependent HD superfamily phosphohydrolase
VSDLLRAWRDALPSTEPDAVSRAGADLLARWSEPGRSYHTVDHLRAVLAIIDKNAGEAADRDAVRLAAWFHDAVYDPQRMDNEENSAMLAEATLPGLGVPAYRVAEVARLVRLTATHNPAPGDRNGGLLVDADLAILASPRATYRAYTLAVRLEYSHLDDATFAAGRISVLQRLLRRPRLFHTPALQDLWEDSARQNLADELGSVGSS